MKLSKIKRAIAGSKAWTLATLEDGAQWIGDGIAAFAVPSDIDMTAKNAAAILDINPDKRADYSVRELVSPPAWWDRLPIEDDETELTIQATVIHDVRTVEVMTTRDGECVMVNAEYLKPCNDAENGLAFSLRRRYNPDTGEEKEPLVVVYDDMLACALITPLHEDIAQQVWNALRRASHTGLVYAGGKGNA